MTIRYCSDLHLEFGANREFLKRNPIEPGTDVLILAGDIILFTEIDRHKDLFDYLADSFGVTYWIPGNHEYYHFDLAERTGSFQIAIRENIFLLNNKTVNVKGVRFVFSTLWTRITLQHHLIIQKSLNDFRLISFEGKRFSTAEYNRQFRDCLKFLNDELKIPGGSTVVVTHHVPTKLNYPEVYLHSEINEAFAVELLNLIDSCRANYWIYGHHHFNTDEFTIGRTKLVTNQLGYVQKSEHLYFRAGALIEF